MKKSRLSVILCLTALLLMVTVLFSGCGKGVDKEYEYNTVIISNDNAPVDGDAEIESLTGYTEDADQKFVELPFAVDDIGVEIVSVGKYTGPFTDNGTNDAVEDVLAVVVRNTTDQVVSFSTFTVNYAPEKFCTFSPTNLPANQSALVFTVSEPVKYEDVKQFKITDSMSVLADGLPMIEDIVGVDFVDGQFIITNKTGDDIGDVYVRYKNCVEGNAYLGGITFSVVAMDMTAYETRKVDAKDFDPETSVIIAVENIL